MFAGAGAVNVCATIGVVVNAPIAGTYEAVQPGHSINNLLVRKLLETPSAWCWETDTADAASVDTRRSAAV